MSASKTLLYFSLAGILLYLATHMGISFSISQFGWSPMIAWFVNGGIIFIILITALFVLLLKEQKVLTYRIFKEALNLKPVSKKDLIWTVAGIVSISILSMLMMMILNEFSERYPSLIGEGYSPPFLEFSKLSPSEYWVFLIWIPFFFFNIFGEELLWRGYILPRQKTNSETANWMLNSFGWMLFHFAFGWKLIILLLPILIITPLVVQKTKNTWTGIFIHGIINGSGFLLITLGLLKS
ncbi:MAG: CPBP family intramembrane metalloprotease [Bacteroidales bacterium]|nr:CPBP family intramembrane metalloprotease [Bacteroidales bacterium]